MTNRKKLKDGLTMDNVFMLKKIIKAIRDEADLRFSRQSKKEIIAEIEYYPTLAGEDWCFEITFDGTADDFIRQWREYCECFDVDEDVEIWVNRRGKNGVPSSIRLLLENAEWKEKWLEEMLEIFEKIA